MYYMDKVCAWCGRIEGIVECEKEKAGQITHTICEGCAQKMEESTKTVEDNIEQKDEREEKLPKWAQTKLAILRRSLKDERRRRENIESMSHFIFNDHNWFVLNGPHPQDGPDELTFFITPGKNQISNTFTLLEGDKVFIGRAKRGKGD